MWPLSMLLLSTHFYPFSFYDFLWFSDLFCPPDPEPFAHLPHCNHTLHLHVIAGKHTHLLSACSCRAETNKCCITCYPTWLCTLLTLYKRLSIKLSVCWHKTDWRSDWTNNKQTLFCPPFILRSILWEPFGERASQTISAHSLDRHHALTAMTRRREKNEPQLIISVGRIALQGIPLHVFTGLGFSDACLVKCHFRTSDDNAIMCDFF